MTRYTDLSTHLNVVANNRRTGKSALGRDCAMLSDAAVVPDLHEVIDLRSVADRRDARLRAIDARVGTNLDVVAELDIADLRNSA